MTNKLPPKYVAVCMDETRFFKDGEEICEELRGKVKEISAVYLYDENIRTVICDAQPRYFLHWVDVVFEPAKELSDEERDEIQDLLYQAYTVGDPDSYMHTYEVERLPEGRRRVFMEGNDFEPWWKEYDEHKIIDEVLESYHGNPLF